jgi:hypothetical protein
MVPVLGSAQGMSTRTAPALSSRGKNRAFLLSVPRGYDKEFQARLKVATVRPFVDHGRGNDCCASATTF